MRRDEGNLSFLRLVRLGGEKKPIITSLSSHLISSSSFTTAVTSRFGYCFDDQFVICE